MTRFGISDQFSYPVQEFTLKNDTLKNGTSHIGLYGTPPGQNNQISDNSGSSQNGITSKLRPKTKSLAVFILYTNYVWTN